VKNDNDKIAAVIICYNPDLSELKHCILSITSQVERIYIIDNTEVDSSLVKLNFIEQETKIEVIALKENIGIGGAHNIGLDRAFNNGFEAVLLLDQDSQPSENMVADLMEGVKRLKEDGCKIATVGPVIFNRDSKQEYEPLINKGKTMSDFIEKDALISSGSIILKEAYDQIGGMEQELFIDVVDFEWCWRARSKGYKSYMYKKVKMEHRVGESTFSIFNLLTLTIPSPIRHYYQFRNFIILFPRSYIPKYWKIRGVVEKAIEIIVLPLFVEPRGKRVKYMIKGIKHGFRGEKGKIH
jgi:rhamnosyltransferase